MMKRFRDSKSAYILLSIVLAVVFWLYVRAVEDPQESTRLNNIPVEVVGGSVLSRQGLTIAELSEETVDLEVEAPSSVLNDLIRNRKNITVTVDVSKCVEGENTLIYTPNFPLNINTESVVTKKRNPDTITATVEKLYTRTFQIEFQLDGKVADGYTADTPAISPEVVVISGAEESVNMIDKVVTVLHNENLSEQFSGDLPLTLLDADGNPLHNLDVTMDANSAYVVLPIVVVKEIPLTVQLKPGGGAAASDASFKIEPATITVSGPEEEVRELKELSIGSIDLSKVIGTSVVEKEIVLHSSLENISGVTNATVTVSVNGLSTRNFNVSNILLINKPSGYNITVMNQFRTVSVRGREEDLDAVDASQIRIVADMSDIKSEGTYHVEANAYLDSGSQVGVIGEYTIVVNIVK